MTDHPKSREEHLQDVRQCMENIHLIVWHLQRLAATGQLKKYAGPEFILQVADRLSDAERSAFWCPADPRPRPTSVPRGSLTSYLSTDWSRFPMRKGERSGEMTRVWVCDACPGGVPHHPGGLCVGYSTGKVEFLPIAELAGHDPAVNRIVVGPDSPDPRLKMLCTQ